MHLLSKPLERRSETEQERAARASGVAADLVAGLRVLKGIGAEQAAVARYRRVSGDSLTATLRAARAEAWQSGVVTMLTGAFLALVVLVGGRLAARGDIGLGELVTSVALALFLIGPLSEFSWVNAELAQGRASAARIADVLGAEHAVSSGPPPSEGAVLRRVEGGCGCAACRTGPCTTSISTSRPARRSASSPPTPPTRRRCCAVSAAAPTRRPGVWNWTGPN